MNNLSPQADTLVALPGRSPDRRASIEDGHATLFPGAHKHVNSPSRQHIIAVSLAFAVLFGLIKIC